MLRRRSLAEEGANVFVVLSMSVKFSVVLAGIGTELSSWQRLTEAPSLKGKPHGGGFLLIIMETIMMSNVDIPSASSNSLQSAEATNTQGNGDGRGSTNIRVAVFVVQQQHKS